MASPKKARGRGQPAQAFGDSPPPRHSPPEQDPLLVEIPPRDLAEASTSRERSRSPHNGAKRKNPVRAPATTPPRNPKAVVLSDEGKLVFPAAITNLAAIRTPLFVIVQSADMNPFFCAIRNSLLSELYPAGDFEPADTITEENFQIVCRFLVKARCDNVYGKLAGERRNGRIPVPTEYVLPKCLADMINGIGLISVRDDAFLVCPEPEGQPSEANSALDVTCTFAIRQSFFKLVNMAAKRGIIRTAHLSLVAQGTAWWMLSPRTTTRANATGASDTVIVHGFFSEFTPSDVMLAAIVQRNFNGTNDLDPTLNWTADLIRGVFGIRRRYIIEA